MEKHDSGGILQVQNLYLSFAGIQVLSGVSFSVEAGEIYCIIGPNGAGKTSLLNCIKRPLQTSEGPNLFPRHRNHIQQAPQDSLLGGGQDFSKGGALPRDDGSGKHKTGASLSYALFPPGQLPETSLCG